MKKHKVGLKMKLKNFKSEELEACRSAIRIQTRYYLKIDRKDYYDCLIQCYIRVLEAKKQQNLNFDDMIDIATKEMKKFHRIKNNYKKFSDLPGEEYEEDGQPRDILQDESLENILKYKTLKECFIKFIKNYNNKQFFIDKFFNKISIKELAKKYHISNIEQSSIIYKFRQEFLNYLVKVGYFESSNNFKIERLTREGVLSKIKYQKRKYFIYDHCPNDLKIYKLVRENILNLDQYAKDVFLTKENFKIILYHTRSSDKLYLYQVNILRKKYFNNYTLEELVS